MSIIVWIIFGALAGWIAMILDNVPIRQGALPHIVIGIIGAIMGGYIVSAFGHGNNMAGIDVQSLAIAVLGSVIFLWMYRTVRIST